MSGKVVFTPQRRYMPPIALYHHPDHYQPRPTPKKPLTQVIVHFLDISSVLICGLGILPPVSELTARCYYPFKLSIVRHFPLLPPQASPTTVNLLTTQAVIYAGASGHRPMLLPNSGALGDSARAVVNVVPQSHSSQRAAPFRDGPHDPQRFLQYSQSFPGDWRPRDGGLRWARLLYQARLPTARAYEQRLITQV